MSLLLTYDYIIPIIQTITGRSPDPDGHFVAVMANCICHLYYSTFSLL